MDADEVRIGGERGGGGEKERWFGKGKSDIFFLS